ncbi:hypothetical protein GCM10020229_67950 [Kitasatospora albolonga]|uniref:DUF5994 family protein n=1 Tax=Kitasatospora albolonga TaxID=68173 RepID=UPI0031E5280C
MQIPLPTPSSSGSWTVPVFPLLPRLSLEPTLARDGVFDGAWWPRSGHLLDELPDLITALTRHLGRIVRVGLDTSAWDEAPRSLEVDGLAVRIGRYSGSTATISLTCGFQDHYLLLVVPPRTAPAAARAAMAGAASTGNHTPAAELLPAPGR